MSLRERTEKNGSKQNVYYDVVDCHFVACFNLKRGRHALRDITDSFMAYVPESGVNYIPCCESCFLSIFQGLSASILRHRCCWVQGYKLYGLGKALRKQNDTSSLTGLTNRNDCSSCCSFRAIDLSQRCASNQIVGFSPEGDTIQNDPVIGSHHRRLCR